MCNLIPKRCQECVCAVSSRDEKQNQWHRLGHNKFFMLCNLLRQQTRLVLFPRVFFSPTRQCQRHTVATIQRAFFLSHATLQEDRPAVDKSDTSEGTGESSLNARERLPNPIRVESELFDNKNCPALWLANLHFRANAEDIYELFKAYGTVKGVHFRKFCLYIIELPYLG